MSANDDLPDDILEAVRYIRELRGKEFLSRDDRENLNRAKLRIAYWACRSESVAATRENLTYILGNDAAAIMSAYDKYLERDRDDEQSSSSRPRRKGTGEFWGGR
jgi:hypothetical protein